MRCWLWWPSSPPKEVVVACILYNMYYTTRQRLKGSLAAFQLPSCYDTARPRRSSSSKKVDNLHEDELELSWHFYLQGISIRYVGCRCRVAKIALLTIIASAKKTPTSFPLYGLCCSFYPVLRPKPCTTIDTGQKKTPLLKQQWLITSKQRLTVLDQRPMK